MPTPTRRQFLIRSLAAAVAAAAVARPAVARQSASDRAVVKPQRLQPGAGVGLFSPAGATYDPTDIEIVSDAVRALGLVPYRATHLLDRYGYLAGRDRDRAADINQLFADPKIDLLLPIRGDWGCARLLPYLDYDSIRQNPKIVVGFSDLTALLLGIYAQAGLACFHGPNGFSSWREAQTASFRSVLFAGDRAPLANERPSEDGDRLMQVKFRVQTVTSGIARGRLIGGNLSVLSSLIGSPYFPDPRGAILFVEDIGEPIYRIDRMLTQLSLAGILEQLSGFVFGQCVNCGPSGGYGSLTLLEVVRDRIASLGIPAYCNAPIGHLENIVTLPIGTEVEIDSDRGRLVMLEAAVT
ncbi:S66 peptidase family protein [Rubidibacter lacunae]|nr:LD-carboxypeptidase [Rubidibacter lacunae]